jgi:hypothetical protein
MMFPVTNPTLQKPEDEAPSAFFFVGREDDNVAFRRFFLPTLHDGAGLARVVE